MINFSNAIRKTLLPFSTRGKGLIVHGFPIYVMNKHVHIGCRVQLYPNISFFGQGEIIIGDDVKIGNNVVINATKESRVVIGNKTIIAANTYIIDSNHNTARDLPIQEQSVTAEKVEIGEDVWIGASCVIGKGAHIGKGSVIGANSFVNKFIPPYSIAVGSPAKIIKERT